MSLFGRSGTVLESPTCAHCWHVRARGWECCSCPDTAKANGPAPVGELEVCARQDEHADESLAAWLPPAELVLRPRLSKRQKRKLLRHAGAEAA